MHCNISETTPSSCLQNMKVKLPYSSQILNFKTDQFLEPIIGRSFIFHLYVTVSGKPERGNAYARQTIFMTSDPILNVHIDCVSNCNNPMNPSYRLVLRAFCKVCKYFSFSWTLVPLSSSNTVSVLTTHDTLTDLQSAVLNVNPHVFESTRPESYQFNLNGKTT
jgi:REJ domain